jgi:hypothetical protein
MLAHQANGVRHNSANFSQFRQLLFRFNGHQDTRSTFGLCFHFTLGFQVLKITDMLIWNVTSAGHSKGHVPSKADLP